MTRHESYSLELMIGATVTTDTVVQVECKNCEMEYQEDTDPDNEGGEGPWKQGGTIEFEIDVTGSTYTVKPAGVNIRITDPESDDKNKTPRPGTEAPLKITAPQTVLEGGVPATRFSGLGVEIPLGAAKTTDGTYRAAGSLARYGAATSTFASPSGFEIHSPSEFLTALPAPVTVLNGSGHTKEMHYIGPDAVLRLRGWDGTAAVDIDGATQSLVQVYDPSDYNSTAHTFSGSPHSFYRLEIAETEEEGMANGVTLVQSNYGVVRTETILTSTDGTYTRHIRGPLTTEMQMVPPTGSSSLWHLETTVTRDTEVISSRTETWSVSANPWGSLLMESVVDPVIGGDDITTFYSYDSLGRQISVERTDDTWEFNEYAGLITKTYSPWLSETSLDHSGGIWSLPASGLVTVRQVTLALGERTTENFYKNLSSGGSGTMIGKTVRTWDKASGLRATTTFRSGAAATEQVPEYSLVYPDNTTPAWKAGRTIMTWDMSGRATLHGYSRDGDNLIETITTGVIASPSGTSDADDFGTVVEHSTCTLVVTGPDGVVSEEEQIVVASSAPEAAVTRVYHYEPSGLRRLTSITIDDVPVAMTDYDPTGLISTSYDETGSSVEREVNAYGELVRSTRSGAGDVPAVETTYPVNGRTHTTWVASQVVSTTVLDAAGRIKSQQDHATGALTSYDYLDGGRTVTITKPGGITEITSRELDGRTKSVTGSGVIPTYFSYDVGGGGLITRTTQIGGTMSERVSWVTSNWDGSTAETGKPGPPVPPPAPAPSVTQAYTYAFYTNQLLRIASSADNVPDQVWSIDSGSAEAKLGMYSLSGTEINGNGLAVGSADRVTETAASYVKDGGVWHRKTVRKDFHTIGTSDAYTTTTLEALAPDSTVGGRLRWTTSVSRGTRTIVTHRDCLFSTATERIVTEDSATVASPDSVVTTLHGREISSARYATDGTSAIEARTYDSSGRLASVKVPTGAVTIYGYNPQGQLLNTRDFQNQVTGYAYYPPSDPAAGKLWRTTNPMGEVTETVYDALGRVEETKGNGSYRVKWSYNDWGEVSGMRTFRGGAAEDTADLTVWEWDEASGVLNSKTDADEKATAFEYDSAGRLQVRTAPRSDGENAVTTYSYTDFGDLEGIVYTDFEDELVTPNVPISTPNVAYANHDRLGRPTDITDGSGPRHIEYNSEGIDLVEYDPTSLLPDVDIDYNWSNLRYDGYTADSGAFAATLVYDDQGRIGSVTGSGQTHTYTWLPGTTILDKVKTGNPTSPMITRDLSHDQAGRVRGITTLDGSSNILSRHGYLLDKAGRRTKAVRENGQSWDYGYNSRGEVTSGVKSFAAGGAIPGHQFSYEYDGIGNRLEAVEGGTGTEVDYGTPNKLNQYTTVDTAPGRYILGEAPAGDVFVNSSPPAAARAGGHSFFWKKLDASNASAPEWSHDTVTKSGSTAIDGYTFTPKKVVNPTYDLSGNLKWDGRWDYTWDAENRLTKMETAEMAYDAGVPRQKLEFVYDSQSRRISKTVSTWSGSSYAFTSNTRFLWDDWNLIGEYSAPSASSTSLTLQAVHTWGVDLSGTLQGAGGVGGLLSTELKSPAAVCYPTYDGNGNISAWIDGDGEVTERREYSPFGRPIALHRFGGASILDKLRFGFSTKYGDEDSGFLYYGYRYYDPMVGRWSSRDPIGELGGVNLSAFALNDGVNGIDYLGLKFNWLLKWDSMENIYKKYPPNVAYTGNLKGDAIAEPEEVTKFDDIEETEGGTCAQVKKAVNIDLNVLTVLPSDHGIPHFTTYTDYGRMAIMVHERRRVIVYGWAYDEFVAPIEGVGSVAVKCGKIRRATPGEARRELLGYLVRNRLAMFREYKSYMDKAQSQLGYETRKSNWLFEGDAKHGIRIWEKVSKPVMKWEPCPSP